MRNLSLKTMIKILILCTRYSFHSEKSLRKKITAMAAEKNQSSSDFLIDLQVQGLLNEQDVEFLLSQK